MKKTIAGKLYNINYVYDKSNPNFCYARATKTGFFDIVDCWIVDRKGNVHPDCNDSLIPINTDDLIKFDYKY